ncbi:MAG: glutamine--fructose-6-phosphate aminotransferase, partial [Patescibacteria group bacterium]|nr:glutamine--fructose-6-phosphate aminotransferase [Patescibacteria group bacterium]
MCGIVGYIGLKNGVPIAMQGLKRLEYRGYDSAGLAVLTKNGINSIKVKGRVKDLEEKIGQEQLSSNLVIAHTRWATHEEPNEINSHPHFDCKKEIFLVHNGII